MTADYKSSRNTIFPKNVKKVKMILSVLVLGKHGSYFEKGGFINMGFITPWPVVHSGNALVVGHLHLLNC